MRVRHPKSVDAPDPPANYEECLKVGEEIFERAMRDKSSPTLPDQSQSFNEEATKLRWFLLPSEAQDIIRGSTFTKVEAPFSPLQYNTIIQDLHPQHYSTIPNCGCPNRVYSKDPVIENKIDEHQDTKDLTVDVSSVNGHDADVEQEIVCTIDLSDEENQVPAAKALRKIDSSKGLWKSPGKNIMRPTLEALLRYKMISNGDRVLVCVSGGKDSLTLLHTLYQYLQQSRRFGIQFEIGAMTVDPGSSSYDPSPLIPYMNQLGIPYYYERQCKINYINSIYNVFYCEIIKL